jgi:hypothetical protein
MLSIAAASSRLQVLSGFGFDQPAPDHDPSRYSF